jgi:hypothetical protein
MAITLHSQRQICQAFIGTRRRCRVALPRKRWVLKCALKKDLAAASFEGATVDRHWVLRQAREK